MKTIGISAFRRLLKEEAGQSVVILAVGMTAFFGLAGISVEAGHAYSAYRELVDSTNAATLAGAQAMPDTTTAAAYVTQYSSESGQLNASSLLTNVSITPTFLCLSSVTTTLNVGCETSNGGSGGDNALSVTQKAQVPSWFAGMFGITTFNISYTATAAMRGGTASNWNIAIVLDGTASMGDRDSGAQCSGTQESCALKGIQALLEDLYPCGLGQTCTSSTTYVDDVAIYVFPPPSTATAPYDYCDGGQPSSISNGDYVVPTLSSSYSYQVVDYSNNYKTTDAATTLNTGSNMVKAVDYASGCSGVDPKGGAGTYYAQVIYQAQSDLVAQQTAHKGTKNAMIILSDGNATACATNAYTSYTTGSGRNQRTVQTGACSSASDLQASSSGSLNGLTTDSAANEISPAYPSVLGECGQAVLAAQAAANAGTTVYAIGYGSETSGCSSDEMYSTTVTTNGGSWAPGYSPCQALGAMASAEANFFSDDGDGCVAADPSNANITTLTAIFRQITAGLTTPRLIPNSMN